MLCVHSMPPFFMGTESSKSVGWFKAQVDKMGLGLHPEEQVEVLLHELFDHELSNQ